jgi:hypothetical protein
MPRIIITHGVADVDTWLSYKDERAEAISALGGTNVIDHKAQDGSAVVAISADVADVDAMLGAIASPTPEMAEVMQRHGVQPPLTAFVEG